MCTQKPPHDYSEQLYGKYKEAFTTYITERVLPSLRDHHDEVLLKELYQRWQNHKLMVRWLSRFFNYLDRWAGLAMANSVGMRHKGTLQANRVNNTAWLSLYLM